jgi:hypothetical protein
MSGKLYQIVQSRKNRSAARLSQLNRFAFHPVPERRISVELLIAQHVIIRRRIRNRPRLIAGGEFPDEIVEKGSFEQKTLLAAHGRPKVNAVVINPKDEFLVVAHDFTGQTSPIF